MDAPRNHRKYLEYFDGVTLLFEEAYGTGIARLTLHLSGSGLEPLELDDATEDRFHELKRVLRELDNYGFLRMPGTP